ncbi:MAG: AAA family ATPase [Bacteroidia bacterium]|nr:AAA family ATPase [Bacteroidia bacterium]
MIRRIQSLNYKLLRHIDQEIDDFQVLVGPNASGKTTFLDVIDFLGDIVSLGILEAVYKRSTNYDDLTWGKSGGKIELAIEAEIPADIRDNFQLDKFDRIRYEISFGMIDSEIGIESEAVLLINSKSRPQTNPDKQNNILPDFELEARSILTDSSHKSSKRVINKSLDGAYDFYPETSHKNGKSWPSSFNLGKSKSGLGNLPADETKFPASIWLRKVLTEGVQKFMLDSIALRKPSPPGQAARFLPDGNNLPWVLDRLKKENRLRFEEWIRHVQVALSDIENIEVIERPEDRHKYLQIRYANNVSVPSWVISDGTLRLLALTVIPYIHNTRGVFLIEEPENGIHPKAVETVFQALSNTYDAQILVASHSPTLLSMVSLDQLLCFSKNSLGETDIVRGKNHPILNDWQKEIDLGLLFAGGILG